MSKKAAAKAGNKAIENMFGKGSTKGRNRAINYKGHDCGCAGKKK